MSTTIGGVRIVDMPDLGAFTSGSSIVGEKAGSGRFSAASLSGYFLPLTGGTVTGPVTLNVTGPSPPIGTPAAVYGSLTVNTTSPAGQPNFAWGIISSLVSHGNSNNQDVGIASTVQKSPDNAGGTWQYFGNTKDLSGLGNVSPRIGGGMVSGEFNLLCNGPDNPLSAVNPVIGGRVYFELMSSTYKPPNWSPNTPQALKDAIQPRTGPVWTALATHAVGDVVVATGGAIPQSAFRCTVAGTTGSTPPAWDIVRGHLTVDGTVTWVTINNAGNGFTYVCAVAGTTGATEPIWPVTPGASVTDGTVTWQYGATLATQIARVIHIGDGDSGDVSYGAALVVTSPCYDAIIELSGASLDTTFNPTAAAIRLAPDMPIDFSGGMTGPTQNNHTLRFTGSGAARRLSYQLASGSELLACFDDGVMRWGNGADGAILQLDAAIGTGRQIQFLSNGVLRWTFVTGSGAGTESGGNTGSNMVMIRYDDAGNSLGTAWQIDRSTGLIHFGAAVQFTTLPPNATNDAAAAAASVPIGGVYRNGSVMMIRAA